MSSKLDYLSKYTSSGATDGENKKEKRKHHKKEKKKKKRKVEESKKTSLHDDDDFPINGENDNDDFNNFDDDDDGPVVVSSNLDVDAVQSTAPRGVWKTVATTGDSESGNISSSKRDGQPSSGTMRRRRYDSSSSENERQSRPRQRHDSSDEDEDRKSRRPRRSDSSQEKDATTRRNESKQRKRYDSSSEDEGHRQPPDLHRKRRHDSDDEGSIQNSSRQRRRYDSSEDEEDGARRSDRTQRRIARHDSSSEDDEKNSHRGRREQSRRTISKRRPQRYDSDESDAGPSSSRRRRRYDSDSDGDESGASSKQGARMSSGHKAGLQNYKDFNKSERKIQERKHRDAQHMVDKHGMGETVYRDKDGKRTTIESNGDDSVDKAAAAERLNQGKVQQAVRDAKARELLELQNSGFARYRDDNKLEEELMNEIRKDDPMAKYAMAKMQKQSKRNKTTGGQQQAQAKPVYKGPPPKANRFGIRPGYRWDGNDRGNGFEDKILAKKFSTARKAEQSYKWSSADM